MTLRPVFFFLGVLLAALSVAMLIPAVVDLAHYHEDWKVFATTAVLTGFFGGALVIVTQGQEDPVLELRHTFLLTGAGWILLSAFAALPFVFCSLKMSFTDAFFEAVSGVTTTGATVISGLDTAPPGVLFWRAMLQWLGGIGIIVMALSVLPFLKVGGMQLFRAESSEDEKALPRTAQLAAGLGLVYISLTIVCASFYYLGGMKIFDAVAHALTTVSTGGFSTHDNSLMDYAHSPWIKMTAVLFMFLGALPFVLYLKLLQGRWKVFFNDSQVRWFFSIVLIASVLVGASLMKPQGVPFLKSWAESGFHVLSMMTGTGFFVSDYNHWNSFGIGMLFFLMCVGGCAGSTTCGIKVFRFQVLYSVTRAQIDRLLYPNGIFPPYYNGKPLPQGVPMAVMGFFFMFALIFTVMVILLQFLGIDFVTAMSGAAATLSNAGPGFGPIIGPGSTYATLPFAAKWIFSAGMLLGRLELFTLLILFSPYFWRR